MFMLEWMSEFLILVFLHTLTDLIRRPSQHNNRASNNELQLILRSFIRTGGLLLLVNFLMFLVTGSLIVWNFYCMGSHHLYLNPHHSAGRLPTVRSLKNAKVDAIAYLKTFLGQSTAKGMEQTNYLFDTIMEKTKVLLLFVIDLNFHYNSQILYDPFKIACILDSQTSARVGLRSIGNAWIVSNDWVVA